MERSSQFYDDYNWVRALPEFDLDWLLTKCLESKYGRIWIWQNYNTEKEVRVSFLAEAIDGELSIKNYEHESPLFTLDQTLFQFNERQDQITSLLDWYSRDDFMEVRYVSDTVIEIDTEDESDSVSIEIDPNDYFIVNIK